MIFKFKDYIDRFAMSKKVNLGLEKNINSEDLKRQINKVLGSGAYKLNTIVAQFVNAKHKLLLVGGAVRDFILKIPIKDLDIEVYGLSVDELKNFLSKFGKVSLIGKSFGVLKLHGLDIDWSVPRSDSVGRKPEISMNPFMLPKDALRRRELSMNAMAIDLETFELIDPFGGFEDMKSKSLRAPDLNRFAEDPLRFYRLLQFIGSFKIFSKTSFIS